MNRLQLINKELGTKYKSLNEAFSDDQWRVVAKIYNLSEEFMERLHDHLNWSDISRNQILTQQFLERNSDKIDWSELELSYLKSEFTEEFIEKHIDKIDLHACFSSQVLSEQFIGKHAKTFSHWNEVLHHQVLSEKFLEKHLDNPFFKNAFYVALQSQDLNEEFIEAYFKDPVNFINIEINRIIIYQKLSEKFIEKHIGKLTEFGLHLVAKHQQLSEHFIMKHRNKLDPMVVIENQPLSYKFIKKYAKNYKSKFWLLRRKIFHTLLPLCDFEIERQFQSHHDNRTIDEKRNEMKAYADKHGLKFENDYLYCFRIHDKWGRGVFSPKVYHKGHYYKDWRCDLNHKNHNSFGFGAWPQGNTPIRIHVKDWGICFDSNNDYKIRCWAFEIL